MKTIKVILGIIIAFSVVFFATGLFVKETKYTTEIEINKPLEEVFITFNDTSIFKEWIPELVSLSVINEKRGKIGSSYLMIVNSGEQEIKMTKKVLAFVKNKKVAYTFNSDDMLKIDEYSFSENEGKTKIVKISSCQSKSFIMGCVFPFFKSKLQRIDQQYLNQFKTVVEKQKTE